MVKTFVLSATSTGIKRLAYVSMAELETGRKSAEAYVRDVFYLQFCSISTLNMFSVTWKTFLVFALAVR